jgi:hypothetical protein
MDRFKALLIPGAILFLLCVCGAGGALLFNSAGSTVNQGLDNYSHIEAFQMGQDGFKAVQTGFQTMNTFAWNNIIAYLVIGAIVIAFVVAIVKLLPVFVGSAFQGGQGFNWKAGWHGLWPVGQEEQRRSFGPDGNPTWISLGPSGENFARRLNAQQAEAVLQALYVLQSILEERAGIYTMAAAHVQGDRRLAARQNRNEMTVAAPKWGKR